MGAWGHHEKRPVLLSLHPAQKQHSHTTEPASGPPGWREQAQAGVLQTDVVQMVGTTPQLLLPERPPPPFQGGNSRGCVSPQTEVQRSPLRGPSASSEGNPGGSSSARRRMTRSSSVWEKSALLQEGDQEGVPQRCRSSVR